MFDVSYTIYDHGEDGLAEGEIFILDLHGFSFKQFLDIVKNTEELLFYGKFLQEASPVRLMCNHIINTSSIIDGIMSLVRPVMNKEVQELVRFHKAGDNSILDFIEKEVLPIDYGGTNGTIDEHYNEWLKVFETKRYVAANEFTS